MESKPYKQFQHGIRADFSLQQQQNIPDGFYLNNILNKNYLSMNCFKKKKKREGTACLSNMYIMHCMLSLEKTLSPSLSNSE